ncbi:MAG TPA: PQQ-dependent dehydrogenase, methanol/ethanol family [Bryobacteraceae bacterium]|nr:PQQ-dependent dehydrogenase, methanol/ethanol family [Bryobacteraceae bacterium]
MRTAILLLSFATLAGAAPQGPHPSAAETGKRLFQRSCSGCHGENAKGGRGPDLTTGRWHWGSSDEDIVRNIRSGIPGTQMAAFPMPQGDAHAIVTWLRTLSGPPDEPITGDAQSGRNLFFGAAGCSRCHMFGGRGGRLGPDLTAVRDEKKVSQIKEAIQQPDKTIHENFDTVEVTFPGGRTLRGVLKNEDTFSVQMMDQQEKLHFLLKKDLESVRLTHQSLMPAARLTPSELNDLVAFLKTAPATSAGPAAWHPSSDLNVTYARLRDAASEPQNWLTYWGDLRGTHYSRLRSITPANAPSLRGSWAYQFGGTGVEVTPLVVDGLMFVTGPLDNAAALDARTGRPVWRYTRRLPSGVHNQCTVMTNRGFAILGDRLYLGTLDAHLVALDAKTGNVIWDVPVEDYQRGFSITHAPLAIDGKIVVGITSGECALTGFVDAYDAADGKRLWRTYSIAQPGDPNRQSWSGNSADVGGAPTWMTGTYDPDTNTIFWPTGNPGPDYDGSTRQGDNLYSCSVLALDPETGRMKWYFQFTPHDTHDWDATETPVLVDAAFRGKQRKLLIQANRNSFFYVLDRENGEFLLGKPFAKQTWAKGLDDKGRPMVIPNTDPTPAGNYVCPDASGGTNWASPSYDPSTGLFFVAVREACAVYTSETLPARPGQPYVGGGQQEDPNVGAPGSIRALDPITGSVRWNFPLQTGSHAAGVLATAGGVVFGASRDGYLVALDARTGKLLWRYQTGAEIHASPMSYALDGKQYVAIATDSALFTFTLP